MARYVKKPRCVDCGRIVKSKSKTYKGDLCTQCKVARTIANKKLWDKKKRYRFNNRGKGPLDQAIYKAIMTYGLSPSIKGAILEEFQKMKASIMEKAKNAARIEARRTTYYIMLSLGAKVLSTPDINGRHLRTKVLRDIEELLPPLKDLK